MADTAITISKTRVSPLTAQEREDTGCNIKYKVKYSDINQGTGATDTVTMTLGTTPANFVVSRAFVKVSTAFAGTGTQAMTIKVGGTDDDFAIAATSIFTAGVLQPSTGINTTAAIANSKGTSAQTLKAIFTNADAGSPSALTAGELDIYLNVLDVDKFG